MSHPCPARCGRSVNDSFYACQRDWWRLPDDIRAMFAGVRRGTPEHRAALLAGTEWYRDNPLPEPAR